MDEWKSLEKQVVGVRIVADTKEPSFLISSNTRWVKKPLQSFGLCQKIAISDDAGLCVCCKK